MSRFIDKLNQLSRAEPQPMGFRAAQSTSAKPKIQLVASLAQPSSEDLAHYVTGADAGLLRIAKPASGAKALHKISQAMPDLPWGGRLENSGPGEIKQIVKAGGDFVVFSASNTPLAILENGEVGKILEVEAALDEGLLRAANELPVDAVLISGEEKEGDVLTWQHLMRFRRLADLLTKPLLVTIPSEITAVELGALWEAGVDGVVTELKAEQSPNRLKELRQIIDKLAFPSPRKRAKVEPLLPHISPESKITTAEEEEEED